ncbi:MAG TPA: hypothetical protein VEJ87_16090, partial [Acidimicrobiales bacterium]|nr:hypothetical protein [Acidimicrobiales bacterium]
MLGGEGRVPSGFGANGTSTGGRSAHSRRFVLGIGALFLSVTACVTLVAASSSLPSAQAAPAVMVDQSALPPASLPTSSAQVDERPSSCAALNDDPNTGSGTATQTGEFPWPAAPPGVSELSWVKSAHTPSSAIPERPANWSVGGGDEKLTSARSSDTTLNDNPQELCGVEGNSADLAWETTTGRPSTVIAVTDSGIEWCDPALVDKIYLNRDALPPPENAQGQTKAQLEAAGAHFSDSDPYDLDNSGI